MFGQTSYTQKRAGAAAKEVNCNPQVIMVTSENCKEFAELPFGSSNRLVPNSYRVTGDRTSPQILAGLAGSILKPSVAAGHSLAAAGDSRHHRLHCAVDRRRDDRVAGTSHSCDTAGPRDSGNRVCLGASRFEKSEGLFRERQRETHQEQEVNFVVSISARSDRRR